MNHLSRDEQHIKRQIGELSYCICEGCRLGRGSYGMVFRGALIIKRGAAAIEDEVVDVAVKRVDRFRNKIEVEILRLVNGHPNILRYYATERDDDF